MLDKKNSKTYEPIDHSLSLNSDTGSTGLRGILRRLFNPAAHQYEEIIKLLNHHKKEVDSRFEAVKSYTDHYSNILATEDVSPERLGSMRSVLTLNIDGARKSILGQRKELETVLSKCPKLSDEQIEIIRGHNDYVDNFLDSLPDVHNDGNIYASIRGQNFRIGEDGILESPIPSTQAPVIGKSKKPLPIEGTFSVEDNTL